jgi:hypothetical protein
MPVKDLTCVPNNPAWDMKRLYSDIMEATAMMDGDPALGVSRACGIIDNWTGHGISESNAAFWKKQIRQATESTCWGGIRNDAVGAVQKCISDFILSAMGLSANPIGGRKFSRMR